MLHCLSYFNLGKIIMCFPLVLILAILPGRIQGYLWRDFFYWEKANSSWEI